MRPHRLAGVFLLALFLTPALGSAQTPPGPSIDPPTYSATMAVGQTITINKTITLGPEGANLVDLFFLADNTGSMGSIIADARNGASDILGNVPAGADYNFGVGSYLGDPSEDYTDEVGSCTGSYPSYCAYTEDQGLTSSASDAQDAIDTWNASGGGDWPEANLYALEYVAENAGWRTGSQRILVWFGDAPGWETTTTEAEAIAALNAAGVEVIAFNRLGAGEGIDRDGYGLYSGSSSTYFDSQASDIADATGGTLVNDFDDLTTQEFVDAVNEEIELATSSLDLVFGTDFFTMYSSGLEFTFECTDSQLCTDVGGGESRTFDVHITATEVGTYDFSIFAEGVSAEELDHIVVTDNVVPEPSTVILLGTGLLGLGYVGWRRRDEED